MGRRKTFKLFFNTQGVDQRRGEFFIDPTAAVDIQNMHVEKLGQWSAYLQGYSHLSTTPLESGAAVDSLGEYKTEAGEQYFLAVVNGKVKSMDIETGDVIEDVKTGLTVGEKVDFLTTQGSCYFVSSSIVPQKWQGSGVSTDSGGFPFVSGGKTYSQPSIIERHNNRTVYLDFSGDSPSQGSDVVISNDLDPETIDLSLTPTTNGAVIQVSAGDGQKITGAKTIPIPSSEDNKTALLIFKERSVYLLGGYFNDEFLVKHINSDAGCLNNNCIVQVGSDVIFLGENNVYSFTTALQAGTLQPRAIGSENVIEALRSMNLTFKHLAWGIHLPWRNEVWFGFPSNAATVVDKIIVYRYPDPATEGESPAFSIKNNLNHPSAVVVENEFYTGTDEGYLGHWFTSSGHGTSAVNWSFKYPFYDFGDFEVNKTLHGLKAYFLARAEEVITITTEWRGGSGTQRQVINKTIQFPSNIGVYGDTSPPAAVYGESIYGTGAVLAMVPLKPIGIGQQLQIKVNGSSLDTGVIFLGVSGEVEYLDQARGYFF